MLVGMVGTILEDTTLVNCYVLFLSVLSISLKLLVIRINVFVFLVSSAMPGIIEHSSATSWLKQWISDTWRGGIVLNTDYRIPWFCPVLWATVEFGFSDLCARATVWQKAYSLPRLSGFWDARTSHSKPHPLTRRQGFWPNESTIKFQPSLHFCNWFTCRALYFRGLILRSCQAMVPQVILWWRAVW